MHLIFGPRQATGPQGLRRKTRAQSSGAKKAELERINGNPALPFFPPATAKALFFLPFVIHERGHTKKTRGGNTICAFNEQQLVPGPFKQLSLPPKLAV